MKTKLVLISLLLIATMLISGCSTDKMDCEKLDITQCLEHQDICSLCPERLISSHVSCRSIEFCQNIPIE